MKTKLDGTIASYFAAANAHDTERELALFADDAVVKDEREEHRGRDGIRVWMHATAKKYGPLAYEPTGAVERGLSTTVTATVSGDFKGSPATLRYTFTVENERIASLEIG